MSQIEQELQGMIHSTIPISASMGFEIVEISATAIETRAPLEMNINIHQTGFAGSLYSIAVLTAWSLCHHNIALHKLNASLVIAKASIEYYKPVESAIECHCGPGVDEVGKFIGRLQNGQQARLKLEVIINSGNAIMKALMVATPRN